MSQNVIKISTGLIEYRIEGEGPTIMVLNGGHCSRETRLSHKRLVDHGFCVLTSSRPGCDSTRNSVGKTAQEAADSLAELLDYLNTQRLDTSIKATTTHYTKIEPNSQAPAVALENKVILIRKSLLLLLSS